MPELYEAKASKIREMVSELEDELRMAKAYIEYLKEQIRVAHNVGVAAASINPTARSAMRRCFGATRPTA